MGTETFGETTKLQYCIISAVYLRLARDDAADAVRRPLLALVKDTACHSTQHFDSIALSQVSLSTPLFKEADIYLLFAMYHSCRFPRRRHLLVFCC